MQKSKFDFKILKNLIDNYEQDIEMNSKFMRHKIRQERELGSRGDLLVTTSL